MATNGKKLHKKISRAEDNNLRQSSRRAIKARANAGHSSTAVFLESNAHAAATPAPRAKPGRLGVSK